MTQTPQGEIVVYETPEGQVQVDVRLERDTVWLSQRQMAEIFDTSTDNVGLHLKNIFSEGELVEAATTEEYSVVQTEGRRQVRRRVRHYNLDAIISVGYRVSPAGGWRLSERGVTESAVAATSCGFATTASMTLRVAAAVCWRGCTSLLTSPSPAGTAASTSDRGTRSPRSPRG